MEITREFDSGLKLHSFIYPNSPEWVANPGEIFLRGFQLRIIFTDFLHPFTFLKLVKRLRENFFW